MPEEKGKTKQDKEIRELTLQFVCKHRRIPLFKKKQPIQNKPYYFGLKIRNIGSKPAEAGYIEKFQINPGGGDGLNQNIKEALSFPELNPGEKKTIWWESKVKPIIKGECFVKCNVIPKDNKSMYRTYQINEKNELYPGPTNEWGNGVIIRGEMEHRQHVTNILVVVLTALVFVDGMWGVDVFFGKVFDLVANLFGYIENLLRYRF